MQGRFIPLCKSMGALAPIDWEYPREGGYSRGVEEVEVGSIGPLGFKWKL